MARKVIPEDIVPRAYDLAKLFADGEISLKDAKEILSREMAKSSAADYLYDFKSMRIGERFTRTLNEYSLDYFLDRIFNEYGEIGLNLALKALEQHIPYFEGTLKKGSRKSPYMRRAFAKFNAKLKNPRVNEIEQESIIDEIDKAALTRQQLLDKLNETRNTKQDKVPINGKLYPRDNVAIAIIKELRGFKCQICPAEIKKRNGKFYIEAAHIDPKKTKGKEVPENIIIFCPNHHKEFDYGKVEILERDNQFIRFVMNNEPYTVSLTV